MISDETSKSAVNETAVLDSFRAVLDSFQYFESSFSGWSSQQLKAGTGCLYTLFSGRGKNAEYTCNEAVR